MWLVRQADGCLQLMWSPMYRADGPPKSTRLGTHVFVTCMHIRIHACMHIHARLGTHVLERKCMHAHTRASWNAYGHTCTHVLERKCKHTSWNACLCNICTRIFGTSPCMHAHTRAHVCPQACSHASGKANASGERQP